MPALSTLSISRLPANSPVRSANTFPFCTLNITQSPSRHLWSSSLPRHGSVTAATKRIRSTANDLMCSLFIREAVFVAEERFQLVAVGIECSLPLRAVRIVAAGVQTRGLIAELAIKVTQILETSCQIGICIAV